MLRKLLPLALCFWGFGLFAQFSLADVLTYNMVLQRDQPIHFWGKGMPKTQIVAHFMGQEVVTRVNAEGQWSIFFPPQQAVLKPQSLRIRHNQGEQILQNIVIGDVWLCIGQSNMEWPLEKEDYYLSEIKNTKQSLLRFYNPDYAGKGVYNAPFNESLRKRLTPTDFFQGRWQESHSETAKRMSAVGYYFGSSLLESEKIPIGLVNMAIGGAPIETFMSTEILKTHPSFGAKVQSPWLDNDALAVWIRTRGKQNVGGIADVPGDSLGPNHAFKPGFANAAGIAKILPMPIKGVTWYQGESNAQEIERVMEYGDLQQLMVKELRSQWANAELPFYWVQLSSIDTLKYQSRFWPEFRNQQRLLLSKITHGGMAVSSDVGAKNDVHPTDKKTVGQRLARWALNQTYGRPIVPSGPLVKSAIFDGSKVVVDFEFDTGLQGGNGQNIRGFSLDGKNEILCTLVNNRIWIPCRNNPEYVYYAWRPFSEANLVNGEGLPASTFKIKVVDSR
ncbi:sialate O-acetylesterase [Sediminicola luteus]|uniref:Sialate O-acetylesterase n=2 Tax=Sediminicola luteus TaxID=319238 RepID=A0A2A4GEX7_9FLAO|nr:sialate O-acetylesterase [Sediminicola luteus]